MKSQKPLINRFAPLLITLAVLAVLVAIAAPTIAYYIVESNDVGSDYTPAAPSDPSFVLDFDNNEMKNVSIAVEDKGYPVYVRATIIITWRKADDENEVYYVQPVEGADYTIDFNTTGWEVLDGFYYCKNPVASGKTTDVLIKSCALIPSGSIGVPEEYVLSVEIIVQTVQAIGSTDNGNIPAWQDAWKK